MIDNAHYYYNNSILSVVYTHTSDQWTIQLIVFVCYYCAFFLL